MAGFFNYDSKFSQAMNKFVDCVVLSALWVIFCIPVFTIGTSTTALFVSARQVLRQNKGYVFKNFWDAFKSNFKQTVKIWLILLAVFVIFFIDRMILKDMLLPAGSAFGNLHIIFLFLMLYELIWAIYIFAYSARFEMNWKGVMKNSAILSVTNLPWSLLILVITLAAGILIRFLIPPLIFLLPGILAWTFQTILERIFRRYMTPEDLKKVEEDEKLDR